jgi:hypothetical protein
MYRAQSPSAIHLLTSRREHFEKVSQHFALVFGNPVYTLYSQARIRTVLESEALVFISICWHYMPPCRSHIYPDLEVPAVSVERMSKEGKQHTAAALRNVRPEHRSDVLGMVRT